MALCCVIKLPILECSFIVTSPGHTCAFIMLYNLHLFICHNREVDDLSRVVLMFLLGWEVDKCRLYNWISAEMFMSCIPTRCLWINKSLPLRYLYLYTIFTPFSQRETESVRASLLAQTLSKWGLTSKEKLAKRRENLFGISCDQLLVVLFLCKQGSSSHPHQTLPSWLNLAPPSTRHSTQPS